MAEPRMRLHHEPETTAQALFERARRLDQVAGFGYEMADFLTDLVPFLEAIASLPQQTAEPVAWRFKADDPHYDDAYVYCATEEMALLRCPKNSKVEPLYAALEPRASDRERTIEECARIAHKAHLTYAQLRDTHRRDTLDWERADASTKAAAAIWHAIGDLLPRDPNDPTEAAIRKLSEVSHEH